MASSRLRLLTAVLLVAAAALFAIGVAIERHDNHSEPGHAQAPPTSRLRFADADQNEPSSSDQGTETSETPKGGGETPAEHAREHNSELVFGINTESTPLVIAAVAISVILATAVIASDALMILAAVIGFALVAAAFDVREAFHQADESRTNLIVIAAIVAALHLAIAANAAVIARRRTAGAG